MAYKGTFYCFNHQNKARVYVDALVGLGFRQTIFPARALFVLADSDVSVRRTRLEQSRQFGSYIFLYPHAAPPQLTYDGLYEPWAFTKANFTIAQGHVEVMRTYGYPDRIPLHPVGWALCEQRAFVPGPAPRRVLFAPIHPNANGYLCELDLSINRAVMARLLPLVRSGEISLTVRHLQPLQRSGLEVVPGVRYIWGTPNQAVDDIDAADVVISRHTFAYLAVARGKPTLMMAEWETPRSGSSDATLRNVGSWPKYRDLMMFPLDVLAGDDTGALLRKAAASDAEIEGWRSKFIGSPFDPRLFVKTLEGYL
jgi:hypothetical protein